MDLVSDITAYNPLTAERIHGLTRYFAAKGGTDLSAQHQALGMINQQVVRQSSMLSYMDSYLLIGLLFVVTLPLLLIVARGKTQGPPVMVSDH
jgi:DHA2 family multidrug resistance protein